MQPIMSLKHPFGNPSLMRLLLTIVVFFFLGTVISAQASELVRKFSGSRSTETAE